MFINYMAPGFLKHYENFQEIYFRLTNALPQHAITVCDYLNETFDK